MKIIDTSNEFENTIIKMVRDKPSYLYIATFNFRVDKFTDTIMDAIPVNCKAEFLIGLSDRTSKKQITFLYNYFKKYRQVNVKFVTNFHAKIVITNKLCITGGRNITGSEWTDLSFLTDNRSEILKCKKKFEKLFGQLKKSF